MKPQNIGIALSGGGIRATIFHLGIFKWLAENELLEQVRRVSSVSGASLCVGMIYSHNNLKWPTGKEFLNSVLPSIEKALLANDLQLSAIFKLIASPSYWNKKVNVIAKALEDKWGVRGCLSKLTGDVKWYINCTTYETGKRFRFCKESMGDYTIGYVENPEIPISEVMAASAGFPMLIGPYSLKTSNYHWVPSKYSGLNSPAPISKTLHLWDGGVYDNLGLESIFKPDNGGTLSEGLDFMIVSNASASIEFRSRPNGLSANNLMRILDITMGQEGSLRSRAVMDFISRTGQGMYIKIGNSAEKIASAGGCSEEEKRQMIEKCIPVEQAYKAMNYPTTLAKPLEMDFHMLLRHGYEVADCTYQCYRQKV